MARTGSFLLIVALLLIVPRAAWAQSGYYLTPSLTLAGVYDDNIFNETGGRNRGAGGRGRVGDLSARLTPGFQAGYRSDPFTALLNYSFTIERFLEHTELDSVGGFQNGTLTVSYVPSPLAPWSLSGSAFYRKSQNSGDIDPLTGFQTSLTGFEGGRRETTSYGGGASATYQITSLMAASGGYRYNHTEAEGLASSTEHGFDAALTRIPVNLDYALTASARYSLSLLESESAGVSTSARDHDLLLSLAKEVKPRDTFTLNYGVTILEQNVATTVSHTATVGWIHQFTANISAGGEVGIRVTDGEIGPEVRLNINTATGPTQNLRLSLTTTSEARAALDRQGTIIRTQTYTGTLAYQTPIQYLSVNVSPSVSQIIGDSGSVRESYFYTLSASIEYSYPILKWLNAFARYEFNYRDSGREAFQPEGREIIHNIVAVGLTASYPFRLY